jgi:hypothetical protein
MNSRACMGMDSESVWEIHSPNPFLLMLEIALSVAVQAVRGKK